MVLEGIILLVQNQIRKCVVGMDKQHSLMFQGGLVR